MDYYNTLGITKNATPDEIKKAYRKLAMQHHPDREGDPEKFQQISEAYDALKDPDRRSRYDMFGSGTGRGQQQYHDVDLNDIFAQFFNNSFNQQFRSNARAVMNTTLTVSLHEAYHGTEKVIQLRTLQDTKGVSIKISPGVKTGDQMRYDNVIENTILIVSFHVMDDLKFTRNGNDLYCNLPISVLDLITGATVPFKTIDQKDVNVEIPPLTQPNKAIRLHGKGMPVYGHPGFFGDQILNLKPFIPADISEELLQAINDYKNKEK